MKARQGVKAAKKAKRRRMSRVEVVKIIHDFLQDLMKSRLKVFSRREEENSTKFSCEFQGEQILICDLGKFRYVRINGTYVPELTWQLASALVEWAQDRVRPQETRNDRLLAERLLARRIKEGRN